MANNAKAIAAAGAGTLALIAAAAPFVAQWEGLRTDPYVDVAGVLSVCSGETAVQMRRYTPAECQAMFQTSLAKHAGGILQAIPEDAPRSVKLAFISFAYNVGVPLASSSKAAQAARAGDYARACANIGAFTLIRVTPAQWNACPAEKRRIGSDGVRRCVSQGLVNRRTAETKLCLADLIRS